MILLPLRCNDVLYERGVCLYLYRTTYESLSVNAKFVPYNIWAPLRECKDIASSSSRPPCNFQLSRAKSSGRKPVHHRYPCISPVSRRPDQPVPQRSIRGICRMGREWQWYVCHDPFREYDAGPCRRIPGSGTAANHIFRRAGIESSRGSACGQERVSLYEGCRRR